MVKFVSLTGPEAKKIEEQAVEKYLNEIKSSAKTVVVKYPPPHTHSQVLKVKAIFPFQLFPDELIVYKDKVTIITRFGPGMIHTRDMNLHDIAQVQADVGPIFGHLHIIPKLRTEEPIVIDRLSRKDALGVREIVEDMIEEDQRGHPIAY